MNLQQIRAGLKGLKDQAVAKYGATVQAAIQAGGSKLQDVQRVVKGFSQRLLRIRDSLERQKQLLAQLPEEGRGKAATALQALVLKYNQLAEPFWSDVQASSAPPAPSTGVAPAVVILAGIGVVGVLGVAWALAYWEHSEVLEKEVDLQEKELIERVAASKEGRALQATTLPTPPSQKGGGGAGLALGLLVAAGLGVGGAVLLPRMLKR